jgi:hypothetical protein
LTTPSGWALAAFDFVQQLGLAQDVLGLFHHFEVHLFLGSNPHPVRDVDQQFNQVVRDFALPLPTQRRQERVAPLGRMTP